MQLDTVYSDHFIAQDILTLDQKPDKGAKISYIGVDISDVANEGEGKKISAWEGTASIIDYPSEKNLSNPAIIMYLLN